MLSREEARGLVDHFRDCRSFAAALSIGSSGDRLGIT